MARYAGALPAGTFTDRLLHPVAYNRRRGARPQLIAEALLARLRSARSRLTPIDAIVGRLQRSSEMRVSRGFCR
jgi:hypothetical protein